MQSKAEVIELKGKPWLLFASPAEVSLACAVSADFEMHRGIAREFKKKFGNVHELREQSQYKYMYLMTCSLIIHEVATEPIRCH